MPRGNVSNARLLEVAKLLEELPEEEAMRKLGLRSSSLRAYKSMMRRRHIRGAFPVRSSSTTVRGIAISIRAWNTIRAQAAIRGLKAETLARRLLEIIAEDGMFNAVLDEESTQ